jgi:hypothetical protein
MAHGYIIKKCMTTSRVSGRIKKFGRLLKNSTYFVLRQGGRGGGWCIAGAAPAGPPGSNVKNTKGQTFRYRLGNETKTF